MSNECRTGQQLQKLGHGNDRNCLACAFVVSHLRTKIKLYDITITT